MDTFDTTKSVVSSEDLTDGIDFVNEFSNELAKYQNRITGSENETACARAIRDRLQEETCAKTRLEAYRAYPLLGRGAFPFLGLWYALSFVLYFVSFAGGDLAGRLLTLLALCVFMSGSGVILAMFFGDRKLKCFLNQKISYNVVSEFSKPYQNRELKQKERVFIIADNHDALMGSFVKDFGKFSKITMLFAPISMFLFVLFCILKMAIGATTSAQITVFTVLPAIFGVFGIAIILTHFSPFEQHARQNNGVATSIAMATFAYFAEQPELLEEGVRIVYVSFGGENSAHGGSHAFVQSHPEFADAKVLCLQDIQSGDIKLAECDSLRNIAFSTPLISLIRSSAHEQGIEVKMVPHDLVKHKINSLHGFCSNAFAKNGTESATLLAKDYAGESRVLDRNDAEKIFSLTVGTFFKLMKEIPIEHEDVKVDNDTQSTQMEIVDATGK